LQETSANQIPIADVVTHNSSPCFNRVAPTERMVMLFGDIPAGD
jgi:hypothetical protein